MTHAPQYFTKAFSPQVKEFPASRLPRTLTTSFILGLLLLFITRYTAFAEFTLTTAAIGGQTTVTVFAGGVLTVDVTATRNHGTDYNGTSYRWGTSGNFICVDTPDNLLGAEGTATDTEQISVDVPQAPGAYTLQVRAHSASDCGVASEVGATVSLIVNVIAGNTNKDLVPACGTDVILVLDESGSIATAGAIDDVRSAANAFLAGLNNTGSRVAIIEFNTQARQVFGYTDVNTAKLPTLQNYINDVGSPPQGGYNPGEYNDPAYYTNWDDAFAKVEARNTANGVAPLVVFITDGDPTAYDEGENIDPSATYPANDPRLVKAIEGANAVKAQGSHILAVGVGDGLSSAESQERLQMISGPNLYQGVGTLNIATTDLMLVSNYAGLTSALQKIVTELCRSSVTITKLVDPGTGDYAPGPGWEFSALARYPQPDGVDFSWTLPNTTTNPADIIKGATNANGILTFQWDPNGSQGTSSIAITETTQSNYKIESVVCKKSSGSGEITVTPGGNAFSITGIAIDAIVTCEVKNKLRQIDLELDKSVNNGTPDVGSQVIFKVDVTNQGPDDGTGITVSDTLPSGYTYVSDDSGGAYNNNTSIWTIGNLAVGNKATLKVTASVKASGVYTNYAQVWTANEKDIDSTPGNNSTSEDDDDIAVTIPSPIADLELDKSVNNSTPEVGAQVIFTVKVTNQGPINATGVTVSDKLPSAYAYVSDDSGGAYNSATGIWTIGNLAVNASATLKIIVTVKKNGDYLNYAQVETSNEKDIDSTPGNDSQDEDDDDTALTTPPIADLELDKSVNNDKPLVGSQIIFTVIVTNKGPDNATGVTVSDKLPSGFTYVSDDSGGAYDSNTGIWTIGNLAVNASATLKMTVTVNDSGQYLNYAQVKTSNQRDPDSTPGNDSDDEDDDDTQGVTVGASLGDKVWFDENNNGIQDLGEPGVSGVKVNLYNADTTRLATASSNPIASALTNPTGGYLFTNLEPGSYYVDFTTPQGYQFTQYNVSGNGKEAEDSDPLAPTVLVNVSDHHVQGKLGENLLYTIFYTNTDPSLQAGDIVITTTVPPGTSFVAGRSISGWNCSSASEDGVCTFTIPTLNAQSSGSLSFVVRLKEKDTEVPDLLDLVVHLIHDRLAHTQVVTLAANEDNRTVDAGIVHTSNIVSVETPTPTSPTNEPETAQPQQQRSVFLPAVQAQQ